MRLVDYIRKPFELLDASTSDETDHHGIYANTRSAGNIYSITSTQPGDGVYAARWSSDTGKTVGSGRFREVEEFDRADLRSYRDRQPNAGH